MGGAIFIDVASGDNADVAFNSAVADARYDYGHAGYTGTIAEKNSFVMIKLPEGVDPEDYADKLIMNEDKRVDDKWGPAGCFDLGDGNYMFFGWASS